MDTTASKTVEIIVPEMEKSSFKDGKLDFEIKVITPELVEAAYDFMWENFFPDEPVLRSLEFKRGALATAKIKPILANGKSIVAVNSDGDIRGVRAGEVINCDDRLARFLETSWFMKNVYYAYFSMSNAMNNPTTFIKWKDDLGYNVYNFMDKTRAKSVYKGLCVCTDKKTRNAGLGTKLIEKSTEMAKKAGCEYVYVLATGNYSNKIFDKLGFSVESELVYSEFVDEQGELLLRDTREHTKSQVRVKKLVE